MKQIIIFALVAGCIFAGTAFAADPQQVYHKKDLKTWDRTSVGGGTGAVKGTFSFTRNDTAAQSGLAFKEIGWLTLEPGSSIGLHKHDNNEDAFIIIAGEGTFTDSDGRQTVVREGDITLARKGQSHALKNTGKQPLIILDIIAAQQ